MDKAEVFISYSWKEESQKVADELDAAFKHKIKKSRNCKKLRNWDR